MPNGNDVEIVCDNYRMRSLRVNGTELKVVSSAEFVVSVNERMPMLRIELPLLNARLFGQMHMEITNAPPGSVIVRDHAGRLWVLPESEAAQLSPPLVDQFPRITPFVR